MNIFNFDKMGSSDKHSLSLVLDSYNKYFPNEEIFEIGFNDTSGYVYISLENDIQIVSCFGQEVEYLITDHETGDEFFFDNILDSQEKLEQLSEKV